jgi:serine protease Do/serine protease DegQ
MMQRHGLLIMGSRCLLQTIAALLLLAVTAPLALAVPVGATAGETYPFTLSGVVRRALPSVVTIRAQLPPLPEELHAITSLFPFLVGTQPHVPEEELRAMGSGFIIDAQRGLILTNSHVVEGAVEIVVSLYDGARLPATVLGSDPATDVAILRIEPTNMPPLAFADSDLLEVGDFVLSVGNPLGIGQSVSTGIVSGLHRAQVGISDYEDFIQTDAATNMGDSGGPLLDLDGNIIGVVSAKLEHNDQNVGIGFAIPANMARAVMEQLLAHGDIKRGQIGVIAKNRDETVRVRQLRASGEPLGAELASVAAGSSAAAAGLAPGDVIVAFDGKPIRDANDFHNKLGLARQGHILNLGVARADRSFTARVVVNPPAPRRLEGSALNELLEGVAFQFEPPVLMTEVADVEAVSVHPESRAFAGGLRPGDIVVSLNDHLLEGPEDFSTQLKGKGKRLLLGLSRHGRRVFVLIE